MTFDEKKKIMLEYLRLAIEEKDWHGIADAAMDLRDYENFEKGYQEGFLEGYEEGSKAHDQWMLRKRKKK